MTTPKQYLMRRKLKISIVIIMLILLGIGIGVKVHMDTVETKQERLVDRQAKQNFKNIIEIKILEKGKASSGSIFYIVEITNDRDTSYKVDLDLDDSESFGSVEENWIFETQLGKTNHKTKVIYLSGKSETF
ncbi:hypothetical protein [Latilactobacillus sakei]|uniref:hypothetical protein n=1 Tax=Latilactobacillus sakei TaxID=1599 RepID=UPI003F52F42C